MSSRWGGMCAVTTGWTGAAGAAPGAITRQMKRQGRVWIRIFPDLPVTDKPAEGVESIDSTKGTELCWG